VNYSVPENNGVLSIRGGTATIIGVGTVTVTAIKSGDDNYNSKTVTREITIAKVAPAVSVNAIISGKAGNRKAALTATVTGVGYGETPTGTVKFINSTGSSNVEIAGAIAVTMTDGKAIFEWTGLANQIYKVKAVYSGSGNYNAATSTMLEVDTHKQNQSKFNINRIGTKTYGDGSFQLTTMGGTGTGTVTFRSSDPNIVSISGTTATIHKAGTVTITATKAEDNIYNEASDSVALTIVSPYIPPTNTPSIKEGWKAIQGQLEQSQKGNKIAIKMDGTTIVPKTVLQSLVGKDTTLVLDLGDGITWSINGQSITDSNLKDVDLGVTLNTDASPAELISQVKGEQAPTTLSLAYDVAFGFTSVLTINLNEINAGKYGNLFYYDPETKQLRLQAVGKVGEKGTVDLPFIHVSDYAVIISEEPMLEKTLDQIAISAVQGTLYVGGTEKKSITLKLELPQPLKEAVEKDSSVLNITYQSSNPKVAIVNVSGKITARKTGKTTVTTLVTINGEQRKFRTKITVRKAYIKLIKSTNTLKTGSTFTYKAIGYGVKTEDILFYTSRKSVVEINKRTGKAKARAKGIGYIIAKIRNIKAKIKVKVS
jgi:hypothetical protein